MQNTIVLPFGMLVESVDDCGIEADGIFYCAFAAAVDISSLWKNSHDVGVVDAVVVFRLSWQLTRR